MRPAQEETAADGHDQFWTEHLQRTHPRGASEHKLGRQYVGVPNSDPREIKIGGGSESGRYESERQSRETRAIQVLLRRLPRRRLCALCPDCLLYTSDAADDLTRVDLGGRR